MWYSYHGACCALVAGVASLRFRHSERTFFIFVQGAGGLPPPTDPFFILVFEYEQINLDRNQNGGNISSRQRQGIGPRLLPKQSVVRNAKKKEQSKFNSISPLLRNRDSGPDGWFSLSALKQAKTNSKGSFFLFRFRKSSIYISSYTYSRIARNHSIDALSVHQLGDGQSVLTLYPRPSSRRHFLISWIVQAGFLIQHGPVGNKIISTFSYTTALKQYM